MTRDRFSETRMGGRHIMSHMPVLQEEKFLQTEKESRGGEAGRRGVWGGWGLGSLDHMAGGGRGGNGRAVVEMGAPNSLKCRFWHSGILAWDLSSPQRTLGLSDCAHMRPSWTGTSRKLWCATAFNNS